MVIPLYDKEHWQARLKQPLPGANPGLIFDKFVSGWHKDWGRLPDGAKQKCLKKIIQRSDTAKVQIKLGLDQAHQQREWLLEYLKRETPDFRTEKEYQTEWRFISGLGSGHPFETGFIWHRTLGVPYLPGSSVKGMMRAYASQWMEDCNDETHIERVNRLFGPEAVTAEGGDVGAFIVFDALPAIPPKLELDILNPHYQAYYSDPGNNPPADYYNPVPVFFLAVASQQSFRFALAPRPGVEIAQNDWEWLWDILSEALQFIGAGGKTAVGYGAMVNAEEQAEERANEWLRNALEDLRSDADCNNMEEQALWKKSLSKKFLFAPKDTKPLILKLIKKQWQEFGLDWNNPNGGSARDAIKNYMKDEQ